MALTQPGIEGVIDAAFQGVYGPPVNPADFIKFKTALATALLQVLTTQATVNVLVNGVTAVGTPGGPLPIVAQPGTGSIV